MAKFIIVIPYKFTASRNILENLEKLEIPNNVEIVKTEKESIYNENIDEIAKGDYYIFATRHQSEKGVKSLCVHAPGNFSKAELGGKDNELNWTMPSYMKNALLELNKLNNLKDFETALEVTHHGPFLKKPCMFIEIGSSEKEWEDKNAGKLIAKVILEVIESGKKYKSCVVLGGGHYNHVGKKLMLDSEYAVGHICPKYNLKNLNENILKQMMERNCDKVSLAVLDWKGLGEYKNKTVELLEKLNIKYERYDKITKGI